MPTYKTKAFARFAAQERLQDTALCEAIQRARRGQVDADLGGGVIKQRVARQGGGRSRGLRAVVLFRRGDRAIFAYGFAKSRRSNLDGKELKTFQSLANRYFALDKAQFAMVLRVRELIEVKCDDEAIQE